MNILVSSLPKTLTCKWILRLVIHIGWSLNRIQKGEGFLPLLFLLAQRLVHKHPATNPSPTNLSKVMDWVISIIVSIVIIYSLKEKLFWLTLRKTFVLFGRVAVDLLILRSSNVTVNNYLFFLNRNNWLITYCL